MLNIQGELVCRHLDRTRSFLTRQRALTARSIRRLAPSEAADQQLLLAVKGHPGRLKAMTDEPEVLPLPPAQSSTPIRLREPTAEDIAAEPAPATPAGGAEESKHCEEEQPEEKMKTDTQMDDVEEEREAPVPRKRGETSDSTSPCSLFRRLYAPLRRMHREGPTITSKHAHTTRSRRRKSS